MNGRMNAQSRAAVVAADLERELGAEKVATDPDAVKRMLRDQSWLSPQLHTNATQRTDELGPTQGIQAAVAPTSIEELMAVAAAAARERVPLTVRGAATSNFGLISPDHGGLLLDMRRLNSVPMLNGDETFSARAGTVHGAFERAARAHAREMPVLTTTYANATIGGWLAGGHVGLGSGCHGAIWDGLVKSVSLVTVEETPRLIRLVDEDAYPVLHTFGAGGLISEVTLRSEPVHEWTEAVGFFARYEDAVAFTTELSLDRRYRHRAATAQEEGLTKGLKAFAPLGRSGSCVLLIVDAAQYAEVERLAKAHRGELLRWQAWDLSPQARPSIGNMVYGHRMLWVKQQFPGAAFVHVYFDPGDPMAGQQALKERFGDALLMETKFIRSPWMLEALGFAASSAALAASVVTVVDGSAERVRSVLEHCDLLGLKYQNSHTNVVEDNGLFADVSSLVEHKAKVDPYNLVNRGRLRSARQMP